MVAFYEAAIKTRTPSPARHAQSIQLCLALPRLPLRSLLSLQASLLFLEHVI